MEISADSWFTESDSLWPGQAFSLQIEKILYRGNSKFQDILVFKRLDLYYAQPHLWQIQGSSDIS